jgi:hypothetical protein
MSLSFYIAFDPTRLKHVHVVATHSLTQDLASCSVVTIPRTNPHAMDQPISLPNPRPWYML